MARRCPDQLKSWRKFLSQPPGGTGGAAGSYLGRRHSGRRGHSRPAYEAAERGPQTSADEFPAEALGIRPSRPDSVQARCRAKCGAAATQRGQPQAREAFNPHFKHGRRDAARAAPTARSVPPSLQEPSQEAARKARSTATANLESKGVSSSCPTPARWLAVHLETQQEAVAQEHRGHGLRHHHRLHVVTVTSPTRTLFSVSLRAATAPLAVIAATGVLSSDRAPAAGPRRRPSPRSWRRCR